MFYKTPLASLVGLLLKNQYELRELFSSPPLLRDPFDVGVRAGQASGRLSLCMAKNVLELGVEEGDRAYHLVMPLYVEGGAAPVVKLSLKEGNTATEKSIEGASLFSIPVPEEFRALHQKVLDYLKKILPEALLAKLSSSSDPTAETKEAGAQDNLPARTEDEAQWYTIPRHNQPDLRLRGKLVAHAWTPLRHGRQHLWEVYVTPSGKAVGVKRGLSWWVGETETVESKIADRLEDLTEFFGYSPLAKQLYARLGLNHTEVLE